MKKKPEKDARHVRLYHWLLRSPAWRSLTPNARAIYLELAARYAGPGSTNGRISYSVREAAYALGISKATASRALLQLRDRGFIKQMEKGAFNRKIRHATTWRLTEFGCDVTGELASKDFMRWTGEKQNPVPEVKPTVPLAKPIGPPSETVVLKSPAKGI